MFSYGCRVKWESGKSWFGSVDAWSNLPEALFVGSKMDDNVDDLTESNAGISVVSSVVVFGVVVDCDVLGGYDLFMQFSCRIDYVSRKQLASWFYKN